MHEPGSTGHVLSILRDGSPRTRSELADMTGHARATVTHRLSKLVDTGLVRETQHVARTGDRPSTAFEFNGAANVVLAVDLGANHATYAITDLDRAVLAHATDLINIAEGPARVMELVQRRFADLCAGLGLPSQGVLAAGVGLPGPIDHSTGRPANPPIMPGWDGYDAQGVLSEHLGCPVFVDNDANLLALGARSTAFPHVDDLVFVKVATGIGAGIISGGRLLRGANGAAGDLGHTHIPAAVGLVCRCGNEGCLESLAGGSSMAAALTAQGLAASSPRDIVSLARQGNLTVLHALRLAGEGLGHALAACVALFNPSVLVLGGEIMAAGQPLLAGVRQAVYSRALPPTSRRLRVTIADSGALGGVLGASQLAIEGVLSSPCLDAALESDPAVS